MWVFLLLFFTICWAGCHSPPCMCTSIRDSDCSCGKEAFSPVCNCSYIRKECWTPRAAADYGITQCTPGSTSVSIVLFASSVSPAGVAAIRLFKQVLEVADKWLEVKIVFLVEDYWVQSRAGNNEIERAKLILCARQAEPVSKYFFPYLYCITLNTTATANSEHARNCAVEHGYDYTGLETCLSENGDELLEKDLLTHHPSQLYSTPNYILDGQTTLINVSDTPKVVLENLCYSLQHPNTTYSFPFWVFTYTSCAAVAFIVVMWAMKKSSSRITDSLMQLFFESACVAEDSAEAVLRRWREGREEAWANTLLSNLSSVSTAGSSSEEDDGGNSGNALLPSDSV